MSKKFAFQADLTEKKVSFDKLSDNAYAYMPDGHGVASGRNAERNFMERSLLSVVAVADAQSGCTGFHNLTHGWQLLAAEGHRSWHQSLWTIRICPLPVYGSPDLVGVICQHREVAVR
jgi:hypothetical protein